MQGIELSITFVCSICIPHSMHAFVSCVQRKEEATAPRVALWPQLCSTIQFVPYLSAMLCRSINLRGGWTGWLVFLTKCSKVGLCFCDTALLHLQLASRGSVNYSPIALLRDKCLGSRQKNGKNIIRHQPAHIILRPRNSLKPHCAACPHIRTPPKDILCSMEKHFQGSLAMDSFLRFCTKRKFPRDKRRREQRRPNDSFDFFSPLSSPAP